MKSNNLFRDQVNQVTSLFEGWSECEQTVALCTLFKLITTTQCKFLAQVLNQTDCSDVYHIEDEANNPAYVSSLSNETKQVAINKLLAHLLLLRASNHAAKKEYLKLISSILNFTNQNGQNVEESRQILSYSLMHPAFSSEERSDFTLWIGKLEGQFTYGIGTSNSQRSKESLSHSDSLERLSNQSSPSHFSNDLQNTVCCTSMNTVTTNGWHSSEANTNDLDPHISISAMPPSNPPPMLQNQQHNQLNRMNHLSSSMLPSGDHHINTSQTSNGHMPLMATKSAPVPTCSQLPNGGGRTHAPLVRTTSLAPHSYNINDWLRKSEEHSCDPRMRSGGDHAPLSPQNSVTSSGSGGDAHPDDGGPGVRNSFMEEGSGMRDVPLWLKSLRLHKYSYLFQQMSYEEMLSITEEWLESQNVTKGARTKIVLSINKLKERQELLRTYEKDVVKGGPVRTAITEMKSMLNSPMKAFPVENCQMPPSSPGADGEIMEGDLPAQFVRLMGKVCTQLLVASRPEDECFNMYLGLIDKCCAHEAFTYRHKKLLSSWKQEIQRSYCPLGHKYNAGKVKAGWGNTFPLAGANRTASSFGQRPSKPGPQFSFGPKRSIQGGTTTGQLPLQRNSSLNPSMFSRPSFLDTGKQAVTRTNSAPLRSANLGLVLQESECLNGDSSDNYAQLDSLCLSVTEHALGGSDSIERGQHY